MQTFKNTFIRILCGVALLISAAQVTLAASGQVQDAELASIKQKLNGSSSEVNEAIHKIRENYSRDPAVIAAVNQFVLEKHQSRDKADIKALEHMCEILGESGFTEYKSTLDQLGVDRETNRRVRKYAKKYAELLAKK